MSKYNNMFTKVIYVLNLIFICFSEFLIYFIFGDSDSFVDRLTTKLSNINILYIKLFQTIALNKFFTDTAVNKRFLKFTDNAPWTMDDVDMELLTKVCEENELVIDSITPINSGMISLVFKAYKNDEPIILKIKRRNIEAKLNEAIDNLKFCIQIISYFINIEQFKNIVNQNIGILMNQVDFHQEVQNIIAFQSNCENLKYIKIPNVYKEVTDKYGDIIMMEYINGNKIENIDECDYPGFAKSVVKLGFVITFIHGLTHGDLHCGNILFIQDDLTCPYKIGVIDFGIVYHIEDEFKNNMMTFIADMFSTPIDVLANQLLLSGMIEPVKSLRNLPKTSKDYVLQQLTYILNDSLCESKHIDLVKLYNMISKLNQYFSTEQFKSLNLQPSSSFVKLQVTITMAHGIAMELCKDKYITVIEEVMDDLFHVKLLDSD